MSCGTVAHHPLRQERTSPPPQAAWRLSCLTSRHRQRGSVAAASRFPNLLRNAYCVSPTVLPPVYMDSDQHLPSHTAGTEDGLSRQAGMLPRRKHAALALREADCDASTTACVTPLATVTTWLEMRKCTIPRGSRDSPTGITTDGMEQAECVAATACNERTFLPEAACPELTCSANGRTAIIPFAVFSPCR
ncbi:hypothetical protein TcBrA4_0139590 [Trypanosoma cruzi]|nr:hypothetical protein TcBrA4_0139590 [Trypanosoma cruzi]